MPKTRILTAVGITALALTLIGAGKPAPAPAPRNLAVMVTRTAEGGTLRGNPAAPNRLIEFVSYTCGHCAQFEVESDAPLQIGFVRTGKGAVEVRSFFRNPIDVTASLLANCGPVSKFYGNHAAILRGQSRWLRAPTQAEIARWSNPDFATRMRAIASDLKLYAIMEARGYRRPELDRCLADKALAEKLANQTQAATETYNIPGTPAFVLNGRLVPGHDWAALRPRLEAATR